MNREEITRVATWLAHYSELLLEEARQEPHRRSIVNPDLLHNEHLLDDVGEQLDLLRAWCAKSRATRELESDLRRVVDVHQDLMRLIEITKQPVAS